MAQARARVLTTSGPIRLRPSLRWCPRAVVNTSAGQPLNPWTLTGRRGAFCPYPFLPAGAFRPFTVKHILQGVGPGRGVHMPLDGTGRRDVGNLAIMVVVRIEAAVRLPCPLPPLLGPLDRPACVTLTSAPPPPLLHRLS
jgi:hypothetical protein